DGDAEREPPSAAPAARLAASVKPPGGVAASSLAVGVSCDAVGCAAGAFCWSGVASSNVDSPNTSSTAAAEE
ncbi:hypothetical protein, partial [Streptomyces sp. ST1020]|uniref:hypothetical protein n=1 Tax=Streptomyces sp. ST1020 TaxID=1848901 RepID=UPI0034C6614F